MSSAKAVGAVFTPTYLLTVTTAGPGDVRIEAPDVPCVGSCTQRYSPGATVTLTARTGPASAFEGWGGACSGTQPTCVVTMNSDTIVTARFSVRPFPLSAALRRPKPVPAAGTRRVRMGPIVPWNKSVRASFAHVP